MRRLLFNLFLITLALASMTPFFWLIIAAFTPPKNVIDSSERFYNFRFLLNQYPFITWTINSIFISCTQTILVVLLSTLGGFGLAKYSFRFKKILMAIMFCTMLVPSQILMPSMQLILYKLGWTDSYFAIIIPGAISVFGVFLFQHAMKQVPDELLNAARIDGCNEFQIYWQIALPIVRP